MKRLRTFLIVMLFAASEFRICAQTVRTLFSFNGANGAFPETALTLGNDGGFYGTTPAGGITNAQNSSGMGTVFKITTNGILTTLTDFNGTNGSQPNTLTLGNDGSFYGTTGSGGDSYGTIFRVTTNGTLTTLVLLNLTTGAYPKAGLKLGNDGNFYGTATFGGAYMYYGTVFKVTTNGTFNILTSFNLSDGAYPIGNLTLGDDGNFYGITLLGGNNTSPNGEGGAGTVFRITTNGVLTTLVYVDGTDEANPEGSLTLEKFGNLYGTSAFGGGEGTVFEVTTNGLLTTVVSFGGANGANPEAALTIGSDGNLYGTTAFGGSANYGTVFRVDFSPLIVSPSVLSNGQFKFSFGTANGFDYAVQYSTDLTEWTSFVILGGTGLPFTVVDPNTSVSQQRFYRIILTPE